jgi:hypothetical protein
VSELAGEELPGAVSADDYIDALHRHMEDREGWCDYLAARESSLLLAVPKPFRMIVDRRARRIQERLYGRS